MIRSLFLIFTIFLPSKIKIFLYSHVLGWDIDPTVKIGFSFVFCKHLYMAKNSKIGHLTVIKKSVNLHMEESSSLGSLNWVTGFPYSALSKHFSEEINRRVLLHIGKHSAITNRHLVDCTDAIIIGNFSTIAGFRSQFLTHSVDLKKSRQSCMPIIIGNYCFIGTGVIFLPGAQIPNYSIVAAGALANKKFSDEMALYGGIPMSKIKNLDISEYKYMSRHIGFIT